MSIVSLVTQKKKYIVFGAFFIVYILFWWWFFLGKKPAEKPPETKQDVAHNTSQQTQKEEKSRGGCVVDQCGAFWVSFMISDTLVKAPIVEGVTDEKLAQGVGHHKTTALPSREKGNVVLSGHRWKFGKNPLYKVFEDLDALKNGDRVTVHYRDQDYVYEVYEIETVAEDAIEILSQDVDDAIVTLYTCTPKYSARNRLVVRARLVE